MSGNVGEDAVVIYDNDALFMVLKQQVGVAKPSILIADPIIKNQQITAQLLLYPCHISHLKPTRRRNLLDSKEIALANGSQMKWKFVKQVFAQFKRSGIRYWQAKSFGKVPSK